MAREKSARKISSDFLGVALRKAVLGAALAAAAAGCAAPLKNTVSANVVKTPVAGNDSSICFSFESDSQPVLPGGTTRGTFNDDSSGFFSQWRELLGRQRMLLEIPGNAQSYATWMSQFDSVRDKSTAEKVKAVSTALDHEMLWESDQKTYGKEDYWATPIETIARGQGDCEDLHILKYFTLRYLGVPPEKMYIVIVDDTVGNAGHHATLYVNEQEDRPQTAPRVNATSPSPPPPEVFQASESHSAMKTPVVNHSPPRKSYALYYAMNETGVWSVPAHSIPVWGAPREEPRACIPNPTHASPAQKTSAT